MPAATGTAKLPAVTKPVLSTVEGAAHYPGIPAPTPARVSPRRWSILMLWVCTALVGCSAGRETVRDSRAAPPPRSWPVVAPRDPVAANAVLMRAISLVGTPYRYGGNTPDGGFDCSGLVNYVYRDMLDLRLPRSSRELAAFQGPKISPQGLTAADLVFFGSAGNVSHVGIYVGEGRFVHAPTTGGTVRLDRLDGPYWRDHYSGAKRVLK